MQENLEFKGLIDVILTNFKKIMDIRPFQVQINNFLRKEFNDSMVTVEKELKPTINFEPNEAEISFLNDYVFENLQNHADQIGNQLRQELQRGMLNKETPTQIKQRIKEVFRDKTYTNRLKTVMRTEKLRANNAGAYSGALQAQDSGIILKKYLDVTRTETSTDICNHGNKDSAFAKYGSKTKAINLDEEFIMIADNKTFRGQYPPFHPNCRSVIRFVREESP